MAGLAHTKTTTFWMDLKCPKTTFKNKIISESLEKKIPPIFLNVLPSGLLANPLGVVVLGRVDVMEKHIHRIENCVTVVLYGYS